MTWGTQPVARSTDPLTSHLAAASISLDDLRASQRDILYLFAELGEMTDEQLCAAVKHFGTVKQTDSGVRTRRVELERLGLLVVRGTGATAGGNACRVFGLKVQEQEASAA